MFSETDTEVRERTPSPADQSGRHGVGPVLSRKEQETISAMKQGPDAAPTRQRRKQADRTADARRAFIDATIRVISEYGYGSATTAAIAEEAGLSRGNITFHFGSRATLMAEVVQAVYERELEEYRALGFLEPSTKLTDWPILIWQVLSKPSGIAVLEILQATRSDRELSEKIAPMQHRIEANSFAFLQSRLGLGDRETRALGRLLVWSIRGLTIAQVLVTDTRELGDSVALLSKVFEDLEARAENAGNATVAAE